MINGVFSLKKKVFEGEVVVDTAVPTQRQQKKGKVKKTVNYLKGARVALRRYWNASARCLYRCSV